MSLPNRRKRRPQRLRTNLPHHRSSETVAIPDDITSIGDNAFWNCSSLISIDIPDSVTSIGDEAFFGCDSLESIEVPKSVTHIGRNAFPVDAKIIRV